MKYFIDTEFHEYQKKNLLDILMSNKPVDTIELISIGVVAEDGREYYAISKDFDIKAAWNNEWLRDNVLKNLFNNDKYQHYSEIVYLQEFTRLINHFGKSNKQIAEEIKDFVSYKDQLDLKNGLTIRNKMTSEARSTYEGRIELLKRENRLPQFYGFYSDYDWVVFCWLFGRMIDLPKGFPMYCIDLKQELENKITEAYDKTGDGRIYFGSNKDQFIYGHEIKTHPNYPTQTNEYNALSDARWNYELYKLLKSI
jgi:hypothetical protein